MSETVADKRATTREERADAVKKEWARRIELLDTLEDCEDLELLAVQARAYYKTRLVEWVRDWVVTHDPREINATLPMVPWERQVEYLEWLEHVVEVGGDAVVEKTRDFGASWLLVAFCAHRYTHFDGFQAGIIANKADTVDVLGNPDTMLERVRMVIRKLPRWMRPKKFESHAKYMAIKNVENGSIIVGGSGPNPLRGGRAKVVFIDEAAHVERPEGVNASLSAVSECRVWQSSVYGGAGFFAKKRFSLPDERVFIMDWRDDPRKDEAWAKVKQAQLDDPVVWAREYERDHFASVEDICIPGRFVKASVDLWKMVDQSRGLLEYEDPLLSEVLSVRVPLGPGLAGLDVGGGGVGKTVWVPRWDTWVGKIESWTGGDTTADGHKAAQFCRDRKSFGERPFVVTQLHFDAPGVGTGVAATLRRVPDVRCYGINTGDPASFRMWPDRRTSNQRFTNVRAEIWYIMRDRLRKCYEFKQYLAGEPDGVNHPLDEMMLIPPVNTLITQLSAPKLQYKTNGKIALESKEQMRQRGVPSPDEADALALTFAPSTKGGASRVEGLY